MEYSPNKMHQQIIDNDFLFKKKFGQNFIVDENIVNNIVLKADIDKDTMVIEIGPGAGSLTHKLALNAKFVLAFEIDKTVEPILKHNLEGYDNVKVIYQDFLNVDLQKELKNFNYKKLYVVANLPYYITTPIIMKLIESKIAVDKIVIMVQKEVGNRFNARVGSKDYGSITVFLNYYFNISKLMDVSRNVFMPKPNVDSIVIQLEKRHDRLNVNDEDLFFKLVKDSFKQKRKTLKNNLINYDLDIIEKVLNKYGKTLSARAEELSIDIFVDISNQLCIKKII